MKGDQQMLHVKKSGDHDNKSSSEMVCMIKSVQRLGSVFKIEKKKRCWWNKDAGLGGLTRLVVRGEHEGDVTAGELLVDRRERVELVLERGGVLRVEEALDQAAAVSGNTGALAGDLRGVDKVLEDRLVHSGEGARVRAGLLVTVLTAGLAEDAALADKDNVAVRELLLELTGETVNRFKWMQRETRISMLDHGSVYLQ